MTRKNPSDLARSIMEALGNDPQPVNEIAKRAGCSWITACNYLELIAWIQECPRVGRIPVSKRREIWRRGRGKIPP